MITKRLEHFDLDAFTQTLGAESDRACAVLGAAILDAKLEELFRSRLRSDHKELLPSARPLGSFSARIKLACALGWIGEDAKHDLDIIREVRNYFAHSFDHNLTFSDQSVKDRCANLRGPKALMDGMDVAADTVTNVSAGLIHAMRDVLKPTRKRFEAAVSFLAQHMDDLNTAKMDYSGPNFLAECHELGAATRIRIRITGITDSLAEPEG